MRCRMRRDATQRQSREQSPDPRSQGSRRMVVDFLVRAEKDDPLTFDPLLLYSMNYLALNALSETGG